MLCPFCGGEGLLESVEHGKGSEERDWYYRCRSCACEGPWFKTKGLALRFWNTRAAALPPAGGASEACQRSTVSQPSPGCEVLPDRPAGPAVPAGTWTGEPLATLGRLREAVAGLGTGVWMVERDDVLALIDAEQTRASAGGEAGGVRA